MPYVGIGLHFAVAVFFAVHAMRNGQPIFWLIVLFSFPVLGSLVYFLAIYLPSSGSLQRRARQAVAVAAHAIDPARELREARAAFEYTPTAQHRMRLAMALRDAGASAEAADVFDACLAGPFASDLDIRLGAAHAHFDCGHFEQAVEHLLGARAQDASFRSEEVGLLLARALAGSGRQGDARNEFEATLARFDSFNSRAEFAIWAVSSGDDVRARALQDELRLTMQRWKKHTRELNVEMRRRLLAAYEAAGHPF